MNKIYGLAIAMSALCLGASTAYAAPELAEKTYTDLTGLQLLYSGAPMVGKTVKFTPDASDPSKATLVMNSSFDLSQIPGVPEELQVPIAGPGVLPGTPETILEITLDDAGNFSGSSSTEFLSYNYSGNVSESALQLRIDAQLYNQAVIGDWKPAPYYYNEETWTVDSDPVKIEWESEAGVELFEGYEMPMADLLKLLVALPLIENPDGTLLNVSQKLNEVFKMASFLNDGNLTASVVRADGVAVNSPLNLSQYVLADDATMLLFLDPTAIAMADAAAVEAPRREEGEIPGIDINAILANVLAQVSPMLSQGAPLSYELAKSEDKSGTKLTISIDERILLPLLQQNVLPLLENEELIEMLVAMISEDPDMAMYAEMIPAMAEGLVNVINTTTSIKIGVEFWVYGTGVNEIASQPAGDATIVGRYNLQGQPVSDGYEGITVVRYSDGSARKVMSRR